MENHMLLRVNKNTGTRKNVQYMALSTGTISHVWYDEDTSALSAPKRRNRIMLTREKAEAIKAAEQWDA
jgi:hypothetical protein